MAMAKITKRLVDAAKPGPARLRVWDSELAGFGLQVMPSGHKSYIFKYRVGGGREGRQRCPKIGDHGPLTPDQAREVARAWAAEVAAGGDPAGDRTARREAPTVSQLLDRYLSDHAEPKTKARTAADARTTIDRVIRPALGRLKVADVTTADLSRYHRSRAGAPVRANRELMILSKAFNLAEAWGYRPKGSNPCGGVDRYPETARERYLSAAEFGALAHALDQAEAGPVTLPPLKAGGRARVHRLNPEAIRAVRLLIFTGARKGEVLALRWEHVRWDDHQARLPDSKTGAKTLQLPEPALEVIRAATCPASGQGFVIRGGDASDPEVPLVNVQDTWAILRELAGLHDVRLHDLRHAFASVGVSNGMSLPMIGKLLGHRSPATTARYAHLADDPQKAAAADVVSRIDTAMRAPRPRPVVVPLARKG